ncbi:dihydrofolate reductase family protein [Tabrizicola sp. BL-A-41-H6]|uniref:dihydrofolate reductase family protein n=1 Tax=Tabrizicola sp. BL-A-41-H6 TaxID=3421107 RepID=UPI003D6782B6
MPTGHVFIATSLDGYIARPDGTLDWLLSRDAAGEDHGYNAFIAGIDGLVMGRGTYEAVAGFDPWPYEKPVLVLSKTLAGTPVPAHLEGRVRFADLMPAAAMAQLHAEGMARVYVDGGQVVQSFLASGLIADMVITQVPVLIGAGRPLFGPTPADIPLTHLKTVAFPSGLVQSCYRVGA